MDLPEQSKDEIVQEVLQDAGTIMADADRAKVLAYLAPYLSNLSWRRRWKHACDYS